MANIPGSWDLWRADPPGVFAVSVDHRSGRLAAERIARVPRAEGDERELRRALLEEIRREVGFDAYAWLLTDPETEVGSAPLADVPCLEQLPRLIRLKYATDVNRWTAMPGPVARLHADTGGRPERSLVFRELLSELDVCDVASLVFRDRTGCWGFLDLWRAGSGGHFHDGEAAHLAAIAGEVTRALRVATARTFEEPGGAPGSDGPAVLVLSPSLEVRAQTAETEAFLRALVPPEGGRQPVPAGAYNVAAQLLAVEAGVDRHASAARVHVPSGTWMRLRAARMAGGRAESDIAVTVEPATPADRMDLFCRAYGLSPREAELVAGLAGGADTRQLASSLFVSEHTVQDHLKSIFEKTGTRTRRALLARMVGGAAREPSRDARLGSRTT